MMIGMCAGLALRGNIPFAYTIATFTIYRPFEQVRVDCCYQNLPVKLVGVGGGVNYSTLGGTHHAQEDVALMTALPNMTVIDPCDALEIEQIVPAIAAHEGPVYMRLLRGQVPLVLDEYDYKFELGKAKVIRDGKQVLIISTGLMTMRALEAARALADDRVDVAVLHVPTIKPLDTATILGEAARSGRLVVVAENHTVMGGLGEAVAALLMRSGIHPPFRQIALPDEFLAAGALPTLHDMYGLSSEAVVKAIKGWL